jgi:hypothetical protein
VATYRVVFGRLSDGLTFGWTLTAESDTQASRSACHQRKILAAEDGQTGLAEIRVLQVQHVQDEQIRLVFDCSWILDSPWLSPIS